MPHCIALQADEPQLPLNSYQILTKAEIPQAHPPIWPILDRTLAPTRTTLPLIKHISHLIEPLPLLRERESVSERDFSFSNPSSPLYKKTMQILERVRRKNPPSLYASLPQNLSHPLHHPISVLKL